MFDFSLTLKYINTFKLEHFNITCNDYNYKTGMLCFGTSEGSIIFSNTNLSSDLGNLKFMNKNITDVPIYNVNWLDDSRIGVTFSDSMFVIFDILSDKLLILENKSAAVRYIKRYDNNTFYTCGRDNFANAWDFRLMKIVKKLEHDNSVTCIEFNNNFIYTTSTPGTIINFWDIRYTKKGKYFATKNIVSLSYCRDLKFYKNNLYSKNIISHVHKISQTTSFNQKLVNKNIVSYCGSLTYNFFYDVLFTCVDNEVYCVRDNIFYKISSDCPVCAIGCIAYKNRYILLNNVQDIVLYRIEPRIDTNKHST